MAAKKGSRNAGGRRKAAKVRDLTDRSGKGAKGGISGEVFVRLPGASTKSFGDALSTAAHKG
jgi:hypothetical protein